MASRRVDNVLELVGGTPLVRLNRLNQRPEVEIYAKLEYMNPGGSVKDRAALRMIEAAEASGELRPGQIVLEATSGNTGIGLAMVCAVKGYRMLFTMSESASEERKKILRAYGAEIMLTPAHLGTDGAIEAAYGLAREEPDKYFLVDQFNNPANVDAHYSAGTADEIYEATEGRVRAVVATLGTSGTAMGLSKRLHELDPAIQVVAVEPYQGHKIQGLKNMKESMAPGIFDPRLPDRIVNIDDDEAYDTARRLAREEGLFVGMSAGAAMRVGLDLAAELETGPVVVLLPDGGERYLSTSLFASEKVPEPLRFHNTLTRDLEELHPVRPGHVGIYACGPSLDGPPDLGLCRRMVFADLVRRYLEYRGFEVRLVVNIADVDDRTINQCLQENAKLPEFTSKWEGEFFGAMRMLNVLPAHLHPKASEHVGEMIDLARDLIAKGVAYEKLKSVYFNISKYHDYGKLSGVDLTATQSGKTVDFDYYEKENPSDFVLLKRTNLAELKAGIYWPSPWGNVRPGWHIECALMSTSHLGESFDLHLASTDLVFPHGDNEIAICESLHGKPPASIWLHSEVVMAGGKKVSRTADNEVTLDETLEAGFSAPAVRFWLLDQHYRKPLRYCLGHLGQASATVQRLVDFVQRLRRLEPKGPGGEADQLIYQARQGFQEAMDHDLNVPQAMGAVFGLVRGVNRLAGRGLLSAAERDRVLEFMGRLDKVLGVIEPAVDQAGDPAIEALVTERAAARAAGDYAEADRLRDELRRRGVQVLDAPGGTTWRRM